MRPFAEVCKESNLWVAIATVTLAHFSMAIFFYCKAYQPATPFEPTPVPWLSLVTACNFFTICGSL